MILRKRIGAWTLVLCLLLGMIPTYAGAAPLPGTASDETARLFEDETVILGDINGDGKVDEEDISILTAWLANEESAAGLTEQQQTAADFNQDGQINARDLNALTQYVRGSQQGYCGGEGDGSNLTWVLDDAGTLTISGTGAMADFDSADNQPWANQRDSIQTFVIESGVTTIGSYAFAGCSGLTDVTIPDSVTSIGTYAFQNSVLRDVYYGGTETQWSAVTIGNYNDALTGATIHYNSGGGQSVTECHVFFDANGGGDADSMREVTVTPDENGVLRYTLPQCPFTPPENMTFRAWQCTRYDAESKETVTEGVPGDVLDLTGVVSLGLTAQWESVQTQTRTVTFDANGGDAVEARTVEDGATLTNVPTPVRSGYAFNGWTLNGQPYDFTTPVTSDITLTAQWTANSSGGGGTDSDILASGYCGGEGDGTNLSYVLTSDGTLTISGSGAMASYYVMNEIPWAANRENIRTLIMENGVASIGSYAFYNCGQVESVTIPDSVTSIGDSSFVLCSNLESVTIPGGVTVINVDTFDDCRALKSVTIPDSVTSISAHAFAACESLTDVYYGGTRSQWNAVTIIDTGDGNTALHSATIHCTDGNITPGVSDILASGYCGGEGDGTNLSWVLTRDGTMTITGSGVMADYPHEDDNQIYTTPWYGVRDSITALIIENGVTTIGNYAFEECANLTNATIPDGVVSIGNSAFLECSGLTSVTIPNSVTFIGDSAFWFCSGLTSVTIPNRVASIGRWVFAYCRGLTNVTIPDSVASIDEAAFANCTALSDVYYGGTRTQWSALQSNIGSDNDPLLNATIHFAEDVTHTVTFDANGGAGTMNPVTVQGNEYTLPQNGFTPPSRMVFGAWSVNGTELPPGETISLSESVTVTAVWLNPYRVLDRIPDMDGYADQTWHLAGPLSEFRTFRVDETELTPQTDYAATEGSTKLDIPAGTFARFGEGTHSLEASFQTSPDSADPGDDGQRVTSDYYTVKPTGKVTLNADEITGANGAEAAKAVQGVSYTGRFYTNPKLNADYFRVVVTDGTIPNGLTLHEGGYFTGVPVRANSAEEEGYKFTVGLQIRRNVTDAWPETYEDTVEVTITVEADTAQNVETASDPGYELVERVPATVELDGEWVHLTSKGPYAEFADFYIDGVKQVRNVDYTVRPCLIDPVTGQVIHPLDGGAITGTFIQLSKSKLSLGTHSLNLEFVKTDPIGNKQTRNASQKVTVTQKTTPSYTPSSGGGGGGSSGGGGGSSSKTTSYSVKANKPAHGSISLSATSVAAGKTVTVTVTPDNGYRVKSVSAVDSKKVNVKLTQNGNKYTFDMPKRAVTVSATFEQSVYGVSAATAQHGKITLNVSTAAAGATINGTTTPDKGYLLSGVTVTDAGGKSVKAETFNDGKFTFLMPSGKVTVSATFAVKRLASFVDIQGPDWFFDDAEWAYNKNILRGTTEQYWEPQSLMSSVTSIVTLERLDGVDLTPYDTGADDGIDNSQWYASAQRWARDNNILLKDRPFGERDAMTRGECAVMLMNYLRYRGLNVTPVSETTFTDAEQLTPDELSAFRLLQDADVFRGYSDGSIRPKAYLSRAHLSALLHRLSAYIIEEETSGI